jgi:hypothetical protein
VNGVLATDVSALETLGHSRDTFPDRGITGEYALGGRLEIGRDFRVAVRACVGCHGFELQAAYGEYDFCEFLTLRAGRLPLPFGSLSQRTSPAQVESSSKPLPYIMGSMVRRNEFNLGIIPSPIVDNGAAILGNVWVSPSLQVGYEVAAVTGLKGTSPDIDWVATRSFRDNNGEPAGAARLALSAGPFQAGASAMFGRYDQDHQLAYRMAEADLALHGGIWNFRVEGALRDTDYFDASGRVETSRRLGYAVQVDAALARNWRVFLLQDGLRVENIYLGPAGPQILPPASGPQGLTHSILRGVAGLVFAVRPGFLIKGSAEYWHFSDFDNAWVFHAELVFEF